MVRKQFFKRLRNESLEKRLMMAGDVTVSVNGGVLNITGDANPNNVSVIGTGVAGQYQIFGRLDAVANLPTTINGADRSINPLLVTGVTGDVNINLKQGDDSLLLDNAVFPGNLNVNDDGGNNNFNLGVNSILVSKDLNVNVQGTSTQINNVVEQVCLVSGNHNMNFGSALDQVFIQNSSTAKSETINTGAGQDIVSIINLYVRNNLSIDVGSSDDLISGIMVGAGGNVSLTGGDGNDTIAINTGNFAANLNIDSGNGIDFISLVNVNVGGSTNVQAGSGADNIAASNFTGHQVTIDAGADNDTVTITTSKADSLFALLGSGNDTLNLTSNKVTGTAQLDGGSGTNTLVDGGLNTYGKLIRTNI